ncbi:(2Fe-2S)-binding protein [Sciscionella marina]
MVTTRTQGVTTCRVPGGGYCGDCPLG